MRAIHTTASPLALLALLALLAACESAPRPPQVDESRKRPANSVAAVSLQMCKTDLHNSRLAATETVLREEATRAGADRLVLQNQLLALAARAAPTAEPPPASLAGQPTDGAEPTAGANRIYTLHFAYASTRVDLNPALTLQIVSQAKTAPLVLLRGRTDGSQDNPTDSRIARERANAVRQFLISSGVDAARIRTTHQPAGDHAADNNQPTGRASNRRVEIEIYRAAPVHIAAAGHAQQRSNPLQQ